MPSPYSSIDASTVESNEMMEIQRLRIQLRENRQAPTSRDLRNLARRFVRSRESVRVKLGEVRDEERGTREIYVQRGF